MTEQRLGHLVVLLTAIICAVGILWVTPNYPPYLQHFPEFTGIALIVLSSGGILYLVADVMGRTDFRETPADAPAPIAMMVIVAVFALFVILFGFYVGLPVIMFLFLWRWGRRQWGEAGTVVVAATAILWLSGQLVDQLQMYPGIVFSGYIPRW